MVGQCRLGPGGVGQGLAQGIALAQRDIVDAPEGLHAFLDHHRLEHQGVAVIAAGSVAKL